MIIITMGCRHWDEGAWPTGWATKADCTLKRLLLQQGFVDKQTCDGKTGKIETFQTIHITQPQACDPETSTASNKS
jgi:hypothetical protein